MSLRLSVLDQSPVGEGFTHSDALRASVELAERADALGFTRYWVAEHHHSPGFAGTAPEILAGTLLSRTTRMRIGTGGVLLPRYEAVKVAEVFSVLASLHPGRVDLGLGRAGGPAQGFPQQVREVSRLLGLGEGRGEAGGQAREAGPLPPLVSAPDVPPRLWLLGAGTRSAVLAGELGASFAFAHFLAPEPGVAALEGYRQGLAASAAASAGGPAEKGVLAVRAVVADTREQADGLALSLLLWRSRKDLGEDRPLPSPAEARRHRWSGAEADRAAVNSQALVYGTPEQVREELERLAAAHGVDEIVVNTLTQDPADRVRSYELLAQAFALPGSALPGSGPREPAAHREPAVA
ncbi:MsnO8 family LLM class oxidoreductase [Streptomyces sp. NPDC045431]|uniref:MsnO8 family LLM class oxidoreductase n=1 Tax=Streptomyces sp. NPDC045431 TaxID=3155613 RepID=UPI0033DEAC88